MIIERQSQKFALAVGPLAKVDQSRAVTGRRHAGVQCALCTGNPREEWSTPTFENEPDVDEDSDSDEDDEHG